jgi:hypothetical protein
MGSFVGRLACGKAEQALGTGPGCVLNQIAGADGGGGGRGKCDFFEVFHDFLMDEIGMFRLSEPPFDSKIRGADSSPESLILPNLARS